MYIRHRNQVIMFRTDDRTVAALQELAINNNTKVSRVVDHLVRLALEIETPQNRANGPEAPTHVTTIIKPKNPA